ncbi:MAG TPA: HAD family hydrolase [Terriglobales bacterium]|jgi:histidinol-phosphate phosphatase family protein
MRPAVFFDRDGTLNEEVGYAGRVEDFHIFGFTPQAVRLVNQAGLAAVVVTNQAGVGRGYFDSTAVESLHRILRERLREAGASLDGIYYCPHAPDGGCECRKPQPGMVRQAARELDLDLERSWVIGDRCHDVALAHAVGARGVLVRTGYGGRESGQCPVDFEAANALEAVEWILKQ